MLKKISPVKLQKLPEKLALYVIGGLAAFISLFLSLTSLLHTTAVKEVSRGHGINSLVYNIREFDETAIYYNDNLLINLVLLALSLGICFFIIAKVRRIKTSYLVLFIVAWTYILGMVWVLSSQSAPTHDSYTVTYAAISFANDNFNVLKDDAYFKNYSYQLGYVFFNEVIIRFFNLFTDIKDVMILEIFNAIFLAVINAFIIMINHFIFKDQRVTVLTAFILALSVAPILSCSFVYGIYPGMMFAVIALYCEIRWLHGGKHIFGILSILCIAMAVLIKSNYLIWLVAMVLIAGVMMFRRKKYIIDCGFIALAVVLSMVVQPAVKQLYEYRSGVDLGDSIPYVSWIAMGLNESYYRAPGWFDVSYTVLNFENSNFDAGIAAERSVEEIKSRIKYFFAHPQYAKDFFYLKTVSQWNDTSYQSIWTNVVRGQYNEKNGFADWVCYKGEDTVRGYMDCIGQLVFFAFFVGCVFTLKRKEFIFTLVPLVFLGGFIYHTISEGKAQYIMPYFIFMCGFAAFGTVCAYDAFLKRMPDNKVLNMLFRSQKEKAASENENKKEIENTVP